MWTLWNKIYLIKNSFWKFYEVRSEREDFNWCWLVSINSRYVLSLGKLFDDFYDFWYWTSPGRIDSTENIRFAFVWLRLFSFQSKNYLLKLGRFHRHAGIPSDYLGVMGSIFVLAVKPYLEKHEQWNEETEDAWMELFGHITRVMTYAHVHYIPRLRKTSDNANDTNNSTVQD